MDVVSDYITVRVGQGYICPWSNTVREKIFPVGENRWGAVGASANAMILESRAVPAHKHNTGCARSARAITS